jgi:hypothetical protein
MHEASKAEDTSCPHSLLHAETPMSPAHLGVGEGLLSFCVEVADGAKRPSLKWGGARGGCCHPKLDDCRVEIVSPLCNQVTHV